MKNVIPFPHQSAPIHSVAQFIRLGESSYQKLADLHAAGRLPAERVVVDASRLKHQKELVLALRMAGAEIVLDTKMAELSSVEKFNGIAKHAPWAVIGEGKPLNAGHFDPKAVHDIFGRIARFAVQHGLDAVLAPTHYLGDRNFSGWFEVDRASCFALRKALDREGGTHIAIDYSLIAPHVGLNDAATRSVYLSGLDGLPFEYLWVRASGFGNAAAPLATKSFITAMSSMHNLGKPIIADYLGGLVGQATLAFGAVSGIAHGIGERERFDARSWHKPPQEKDDGQGGRAVRVLIAGLDRSATRDELEVMAKARGGHRLVACGNRACCPHGLKDMLADPRRHGAYQSFAMVAELAGVPDLNREEHFLSGRMREADFLARQVKDLKLPTEEAAAHNVDADKLSKRLFDHSRQMERMRLALEALHNTRADGAPRARPVARRINANSQPKAERK